MSRINFQYGLNGYLNVEYDKDGFVIITEPATKQEIKLHKSAILLIAKTIKSNNKSINPS